MEVRCGNEGRREGKRKWCNLPPSALFIPRVQLHKRENVKTALPLLLQPCGVRQLLLLPPPVVCLQPLAPHRTASPTIYDAIGAACVCFPVLLRAHCSSPCITVTMGPFVRLRWRSDGGRENSSVSLLRGCRLFSPVGCLSRWRPTWPALPGSSAFHLNRDDSFALELGGPLRHSKRSPQTCFGTVASRFVSEAGSRFRLKPCRCLVGPESKSRVTVLAATASGGGGEVGRREGRGGELNLNVKP